MAGGCTFLSQTVSRSMGTCAPLRVINNSKHSHADLFSIVLRCFCVKYHNYKLYRDPVACANTHREAGSGRAASHGKSNSKLPELESHWIFRISRSDTGQDWSASGEEVPEHHRDFQILNRPGSMYLISENYFYGSPGKCFYWHRIKKILVPKWKNQCFARVLLKLTNSYRKLMIC